MNFLMLRSNQTAASEQRSTQESQPQGNGPPESSTTTLEGLIEEDAFPSTPSSDSAREWSSKFGIGNAGGTASSVTDNHAEVNEDQGWITIPYKELPENWIEAPNILSFRPLDRCFVFPGEQIHILACFSAHERDTEIITPVKVAAVVKHDIGRSPMKENGNSVHEQLETGHDNDKNGNNPAERNLDQKSDVSQGEPIVKMEVQKGQSETLLQKFRDSYFFVRIADSHELLWSKRRDSGVSAESSSIFKGTFDGADRRRTDRKASKSASVDRGGLDASASGGMARDGVECYTLSNGDIVVVLQVNVGVDLLQDPILEILQFEKYHQRSFSPEIQENAFPLNKDPFGDLLKWIHPLDNSIPPPSRPLSPSPPHPQLSSSASIRSTSSKPNLSGSSGSQIFPFGNFRSYSMSSLPQNTTPPSPIVNPKSKPNLDTEDWNQFSYKKFEKSKKTVSEGLLSFRGVSLEPERFSVRCGLEGLYVPGKRWRKKIEIIQPLEINSFAAESNTEDLLCVQIKNISPTHTPDIMVYLDAIMIIFEEASKGRPPLSVPIACIEAGNNHCLPNLSLRRGEEHSFVLKPATSMWNIRFPGERSSNHLRAGSSSSGFHYPINTDRAALDSDQYAVLVSCRCNCTESRLFFKQPTSWRPHIPRDVLISVASEMSKQTLLSNGRVPQLPVQVLTLQASNLTSEDLTMTVLAPASVMSPPSVVSLNSTPTSPLSPYIGFSESSDRMNADRHAAAQKRSSVPIEVESQIHTGVGGPQSGILHEQLVAISDVLPKGCTHLSLQSRVPLGCVPACSTSTIKLELLPLTDGIVTLDSLQIDIKEKGQIYIPEYSLKINATSSIATGIL